MEIYKGECVSRWLFPITKMTPKLFSNFYNKYSSILFTDDLFIYG